MTTQLHQKYLLGLCKNMLALQQAMQRAFAPEGKLLRPSVSSAESVELHAGLLKTPYSNWKLYPVAPVGWQRASQSGRKNPTPVFVA